MDWHDIAFSFWVRYNIIYIYINICTYKRKMWQSYFIIMFGYVYIYMMIWLLINFCCNWILCFCSVNSCPDSAINYLQTGDFSSLPLLCHYPVKVWYIRFFFFFFLLGMWNYIWISYKIIYMHTQIGGFYVYTFMTACLLDE